MIDRIELNQIQMATFQFMCDITSDVDSMCQKVFLSLSNQLCHPNDKRLIKLHLKYERKKHHELYKNRRTTESKTETVQVRAAWFRQTLHADLNHYDANYDYSLHSNVVIGKMNKLCMYCSVLKFKNETLGIYSVGGKVKLLERITTITVECRLQMSTYLFLWITDERYWLNTGTKQQNCRCITNFIWWT